MQNRETLVIDDTKYFAMIDNQVRRLFSKFEVEQCLWRAESIYKRTGSPPLIDYPIEGYYYKSDQLRRYFTLIRNFQQNQAVYSLVKESEHLEFLRKVLHTELFGTEVPPGEVYPWPDAPLKRRWDILTYTMQDRAKFDEHAAFPWTIQTVMKNVSAKFTGLKNLPELAVLCNNPALVCAACETNSLGRMYACISGSCSMMPPPPRFQWAVRPEVEALGVEICDLYDQVTTPFAVGYWGMNYAILPPSLQLCELTDIGRLNPPMDWSLECPRVAHLGYLTESELNYFWILDNFGGLTDLYQKELLTTEEYKKRTMGDEANWGTVVGLRK